MDAVAIVSELALTARTAARTLSTATGAERKAALYAIASAIESRSAEILKANSEDIARAKAVKKLLIKDGLDYPIVVEGMGQAESRKGDLSRLAVVTVEGKLKNQN